MSKQQKHFRIMLPRPTNFVADYHDPILENPLDDEFENLISMVGERRYLKEVIQKLGIETTKDISELSDHECRKAIRGIVRHAEDYIGPEMKQ